jgi:hypothetical protein
MKPTKLPTAVPDRIRSALTERPNGCWSWSKAHTNPGYPSVWWEGNQRTVHNVLYQLVRGPLPEGMVLDHIVCSDKSCANPWHVEPATNVDNIVRERKELTECKHGHSLADCYIRANGSRKCRTCARIEAGKRSRLASGIPEAWPKGKHYNRRAKA